MAIITVYTSPKQIFDYTSTLNMLQLSEAFSDDYNILNSNAYEKLKK